MKYVSLTENLEKPQWNVIDISQISKDSIIEQQCLKTVLTAFEWHLLLLINQPIKNNITNESAKYMYSLFKKITSGELKMSYKINWKLKLK